MSMVYPTFTIGTKTTNIASKNGYSPYSDIVWSFDYAISGSNTEAGFTVFLMTDVPLQGGNRSIDLGYSGLSACISTIETVNVGITGGVIAVGFDTTGLFAVSATATESISSTSVFVRDGIDESNRILNSVSIRGGWPEYSFDQYDYNVALSSIDASFNIVEPQVKYKTIRARLGNVGKTIYVDYRNNPEEDFKPLVEKDINLDINSTTKYKPGVSFASPISSNSLSAVSSFNIKNFHTEGSLLSGDTTEFIGLIDPTVIALKKPVVARPPEIPTPPTIQQIVVDVTDGNSADAICINTSMSYGRLSSVSESNVFSEDVFNFGYSINLQNIGVTLTRKDVFEYESDNGQYKLYRDGICNYWTLSTSSLFVTNSSFVPIGTYSPTITAIYV